MCAGEGVADLLVVAGKVGGEELRGGGEDARARGLVEAVQLDHGDLHESRKLRSGLRFRVARLHLHQFLHSSRIP